MDNNRVYSFFVCLFPYNVWSVSLSALLDALRLRHFPLADIPDGIDFELIMAKF